MAHALRFEPSNREVATIVDEQPEPLAEEDHLVWEPFYDQCDACDGTGHHEHLDGDYGDILRIAPCCACKQTGSMLVKLGLHDSFHFLPLLSWTLCRGVEEWVAPPPLKKDSFIHQLTKDACQDSELHF